MAFPEYADADISKWFFKDPITNNAGGKSVFMKESLTSKKDVHFRMGKVDPVTKQPVENIPFAPFGLYAPRDSLERRCLELAITDPREVQYWKDVDERVIQAALENSSKWFGRSPPSEEKLRDMYVPIVREPSEAFVNQDGKEIAAKPFHTIRATIMDTTNWERTTIFIAIYDDEGNLKYTDGSVADGIPRDSKVIPVYRLSSINFGRKDFNLTVKYKALMIWPGEAEATGVDMFGMDVEMTRMTDDEAEKERMALQQKTDIETENEVNQ